MSVVKKRQVEMAVLAALASLAACTSGPRPHSDSIHTIEQIKVAATAERLSQVRFQGVVTLANPTFGFLVVQDQTAAIRVEPSRLVETSLLGHHVEVTGDASQGIGAVISHALVTDLGSSKFPRPVPIAASQLHPESFDGLLVTLTGTARAGHMDGAGQLVVPIRVGPLEAAVRVMDDTTVAEQGFDDTEIRVTGVVFTDSDVHGKLTDLSIFVQEAAAIQKIRAAPDPGSLPVETVSTILNLSGPTPAHRIRLRGQILNAGDSTGLHFRDRSGSIAIANAAGVDIAHSGQVDVVAFATRESGNFTLRDLKSTFQRSASPAQRSIAAKSVITQVARLHALPPAEADLERPVSIEGVITYYDTNWHIMFLQDASGGTYVSLHGGTEPPSAQIGDIIRLHGVSGSGDFAPVVQKPDFQVVRRGVLPAPSTLSTDMVFSGLADSQWVELEGIVQNVGVDAGHPFAKLSWGLHEYRVLLPAGMNVPPDWIDTRFRVKGVCGTLFNGKRQVVGIQLFVQKLDQFSPLPDSASAKNAAAKAAIIPIDGLLQFTPNQAPGHRVHLRGKVAASHPAGPTWIRDDSGAVVIRNHNEVALADGDIVDVEGFAFPGTFSAEIRDATIAKRSSGAPLRPIHVTPERALSGGFSGQLVAIEGRLLSEYLRGQEQTLLVQTGKATFTVRGPVNLPAYESGSVLRIDGICDVTAKRFHGLLAPSSFEITVDSPASITVVENAPWLTQRRTFRALGITLCLIAVALVWVFMLRRRVIAQTGVIAQKLLEVETLKEKAEAASEAKSQFLANMSHEIRTPMNGILGMTELAMQAESPAEQRECLDTIRSSGDALLSILNDLLDLSKIEAGQFTLELAPFSIRQLIQDVGKVFTFSIREKGLSFECSVAASLPDLLLGDSLRLRQVLLNLLGNAVKFTHAGFVAVEAAGERQGDRISLHLIVRDSGIGISPEKQQRIFEAFHQADDSTARKYGGTGLGLSICVKLVTLMGGEISVNSNPGQGSAFSVDVVLREVVPGTAPLELAVNGKPHGSLPLNILVAEDNRINQTLAVKLLVKQGHTVTVAANGRLAVEHFQRETFDLILMDVQMPEMDGRDATIEIRRLEQGSNARIPIIAMTAQTMKGDRDSCFAAGMDGFVSKPIRLPELFAAIDAVSTVQLIP